MLVMIEVRFCTRHGLLIHNMISVIDFIMHSCNCTLGGPTFCDERQVLTDNDY
jgi:hypothetical protein